MYSIAHPFGADEAAKHAWIRAFYEGSKESGLTVAVEFTAENFFIRELGVLSVGEAATGVWDMGNVIGRELRAYYNGKVHNSLDTWSPTININRDPRWCVRAARTAVHLQRRVYLSLGENANDCSSHVNKPHALVHQLPGPRMKPDVVTTATRLAIWGKTVLCQIDARPTGKDSRPEL